MRLHFLSFVAIFIAFTSKSLGHGIGNDCRNQTWRSEGGSLDVMSWHVHYTTNETEFSSFYHAFVKRFRSLFPPAHEGDKCPFGPNFGNLNDRVYPYVCSLEKAPENGEEVHFAMDNGESPWTVPQRAFYVPSKHKDSAWKWAQHKDNRGTLDIFLHANTGCMHDDHGLRGTWLTYVSGSCRYVILFMHMISYWTILYYNTYNASYQQNRLSPGIKTLNFPCNVPGTGCNDTIFQGPPSCGCSLPLNSDAPSDSCGNCSPEYLPSLSSPTNDDISSRPPPKRIIRFLEKESGKIRYGQLTSNGKAELVSGFDDIFRRSEEEISNGIKPIAAKLTGEIVQIGKLLSPVPKPPTIYGYVVEKKVSVQELMCQKKDAKRLTLLSLSQHRAQLQGARTRCKFNDTISPSGLF